ncbi:MAG: FG-GAP repeat protein, partial [Planctomycetota bacterium]
MQRGPGLAAANTAPVPPSGFTVVQEHYRVIGSDTVAGDNFGFDVWAEGGRLAVGAPFADFFAPDAGAAYVFDLSSGAELLRINPQTGLLGDNFGSAV